MIRTWILLWAGGSTDKQHQGVLLLQDQGSFVFALIGKKGFLVILWTWSPSRADLKQFRFIGNWKCFFGYVMFWMKFTEALSKNYKGDNHDESVKVAHFLWILRMIGLKRTCSHQGFSMCVTSSRKTFSDPPLSACLSKGDIIILDIWNI